MYGYNRIDVILEYDNINYNDMETLERTQFQMIGKKYFNVKERIINPLVWLY